MISPENLNISKHLRLSLLLFGLFVIAYSLLLLIKPQFGPTDDFTFLRTIQVGKPLIYFSPDFPYYDIVKIGRFAVLTALEYNLLLFFSPSPSPFGYFLIHTIQFLIFTILLLKILEQVTENKLLKYGVSILLFLSPAFTISWFRLQLPERNVIFYFAIFLLSYLAYSAQQRPIYLIIGITAANLAIYYKEVAFLALGAFALTHLIILWKKSHLKIKVFDYLIGVSIFIYLALYYFLIFPRRGVFAFVNHGQNQLLLLFQNILRYAFVTDPLMLILVIPFTLWRAYKIFLQKEEAHPIYDSMLLAATMYASAFLYLTYTQNIISFPHIF